VLGWAASAFAFWVEADKITDYFARDASCACAFTGHENIALGPNDHGRIGFVALPYPLKADHVAAVVVSLVRLSAAHTENRTAVWREDGRQFHVIPSKSFWGNESGVIWWICAE
jgi:hypothetical protein